MCIFRSYKRSNSINVCVKYIQISRLYPSELLAQSVVRWSSKRRVLVSSPTRVMYVFFVFFIFFFRTIVLKMLKFSRMSCVFCANQDRNFAIELNK